MCAWLSCKGMKKIALASCRCGDDIDIDFTSPLSKQASSFLSTKYFISLCLKSLLLSHSLLSTTMNGQLLEVISWSPMRWLQSLFTPLKKMWIRLNSAHKKSTFIPHSPSLQIFLHSNYFLLTYLKLRAFHSFENQFYKSPNLLFLQN